MDSQVDSEGNPLIGKNNQKSPNTLSGQPKFPERCPFYNEIMSLRWEHVDLDRAETRIVNGKTGDRTVHLSPAAVGVLAALPRRPDNP